MKCALFCPKVVHYHHSLSPFSPLSGANQAESLAFPLTADFPEIRSGIVVRRHLVGASRESVNHAGCPLGIPVSSDSSLVHLRSVKAVDELAAAMDALAAAAAAAVAAATIPRALRCN